MPSVFLKRSTWYLQVNDASGRRRCLSSRATTKAEAKRPALEMERRYERQKLGLEPAAIADGLKMVADLLFLSCFIRLDDVRDPPRIVVLANRSCSALSDQRVASCSR